MSFGYVTNTQKSPRVLCDGGQALIDAVYPHARTPVGAARTLVQAGQLIRRRGYEMPCVVSSSRRGDIGNRVWRTPVAR